MSLRLVGDLIASLGLDKEEVTLLETIFICRAGEIIPTLRIFLNNLFYQLRPCPALLLAKYRPPQPWQGTHMHSGQVNLQGKHS